MNRRPLLVFLAAFIAITATGPALANVCGFDNVAVFAKNSVDIGNSAKVNGGGVVANDDDASVSLGVKASVTGDVFGDFLFLGSNATIGGTAFCNNLGTCTAFSPPVFDVLPTFRPADPGTKDVVLGPGETMVLPLHFCSASPQIACTPGGSECPAAETCTALRTYDDIVGGLESTVIFEPGVYDVRSISIQKKGDLLFRGPTELRVAGNVDLGVESDIKPDAGFSVPASDVVFYVGGDADLGAKSIINANFYVPDGTLEVPSNAIASGSFLGQDVIVGSKAQIQLATAFANKPPTVDDKDAFTNGQDSIPIGLTGSDPEGQVLTFAATQPAIGSVSVAGATATYTNSPATDQETFFTYTATDECGAVSAPATVRINPPGGEPCDDDNDCDEGFFCNTEGFCEPDALDEVVANDQELESIKDTAVTITLTAAAPCAGDCDGVGNDVPLTFSVPATTSQGGTLSGLAQGMEVPRRTASVLYTPLAGFTGADSFDFDVEGDVDNSGGIDPSAEPNPEIDTGTIDITVQTFTPPPPVEARDQRVSTPMNTPVIIALSGVADETCRDDSECAVGEVCNVASGVCEPAPPAFSSTSSGTATPSRAPVVAVGDDTGSAAAGDKLKRANPTRTGTKLPPVTRLASPNEQLFAIDSDLDELFELDPTTGASTPVGSTSSGPTTPASLAFDGSDMYTVDLGGGGLYTLNLVTGAPTLVCSTGISGWQGLASDPTDGGQLYGITQADDLYKIDRTTCTTTRVNTTAGTVGGLITALEFDANGTLWGAEFGSPGDTTENAALVTINKTTGAVTIVSQCATRPCTGSDNFLDGFQGIDFASDGTLYGSNTNDDALYIIDTTDGSLTFLGSNATIFVKGLAFSEEVLEAGFTILMLPALGTLSHIDPLTGLSTVIESTDLPLLLVTEEVTYMPPTGATGDPLATFTFQQSDGLTTDTGTIELVVVGAIAIVDPCVAVGRPPGCYGETFAAGGESASSEDGSRYEAARKVPSLRVVVEGKGTVATSRRETAAGSFAGLSCSGKCGAQYDAGDEVTLYARTIEGSVFVGWQGDCSGSEPITTVTIGRRAICIAVFESEE